MILIYSTVLYTFRWFSAECWAFCMRIRHCWLLKGWLISHYILLWNMRLFPENVTCIYCSQWRSKWLWWNCLYMTPGDGTPQRLYVCRQLLIDFIHNCNLDTSIKQSAALLRVISRTNAIYVSLSIASPSTNCVMLSSKLFYRCQSTENTNQRSTIRNGVLYCAPYVPIWAIGIKTLVVDITWHRPLRPRSSV